MSGTARSDRPLILVADDDDDIRALVSYRLKRAGYDVVEARDGEEALRVARQTPPDLAVLDFMMPKVTGDEVTRRIRLDETTQKMPVILLTARVQEDDVARGFDAGADDYMTKPFSPQELAARVRAVLGRR